MEEEKLIERIKNDHFKYNKMENKINTKVKWTDNEFELIQGRINSLFELITRDELNYIDVYGKDILTTKLFYDLRLNLIKLNIDLLNKVIKQDGEIKEKVDVEEILKYFRF